MGGILTPKNTKTTSTVNLPPYVSQAYEQAIGNAQSALAPAQAAAATPYQPYTGEQIAPLTGLQNASISGIANANGIANPYINSAAGLAQQGTTPTSLLQYNPQSASQTIAPFSQANAGQYLSPTSNINQYLSPYQQDVINSTQAQFNLGNAQQQSSLTGNAASQGALGGDRLGVAQAQLAGQQQAQQAPVLAGLENQNYAQALSEYNTQQQTGLSEYNAQQQAGLSEFNTQQQTSLAQQEANAYTSLYGAGELGNLGQLAQGTTLQGLGASLQAGGLQQQTQQAQDTQAYQNYLTQLQYPFQTAQYLSGITQGLNSSITGTGGIYSGDTSGTTPGSSALGSFAGLGLTGYGLGAFNPAGGAGPLAGLSSGIGSLFGSSGAASAGADLMDTAAFAGIKRGGGISKYADGGEPAESDDDMPQPGEADYDAADAAGEPMDEQIANSALSGIADPRLAQQSADMQMTAPPIAGQSPQTASMNALGGVDPMHYAALSAGLGMMAARGRPLNMVGEGGQLGLRSYEQAKQIEAQAEYRQAMSNAATTRAEALASHYQDADQKPTLIRGKTFQFLYPSTGEIVDSHIDNPSWTAADERNKNSNHPNYTVIGSDNSDPANPKIIMADTHNPKNQITVAGTPGKSGAGMQGGVFGYKQNAWLSAHPNDTQGALDFASGHKSVDPNTISSWAMRDATSQTNNARGAGMFDNETQADVFRTKAYNDNVAMLRAPGANTKAAPTAPANGAVAPAASGAKKPMMPDPVAVPPKFAKSPDGVTAPYNGWNWIKKGNQMVPLTPIAAPSP